MLCWAAPQDLDGPARGQILGNRIGKAGHGNQTGTHPSQTRGCFQEVVNVQLSHKDQVAPPPSVPVPYTKVFIFLNKDLSHTTKDCEYNPAWKGKTAHANECPRKMLSIISGC